MRYIDSYCLFIGRKVYLRLGQLSGNLVVERTGLAETGPIYRKQLDLLNNQENYAYFYESVPSHFC